MKNWPSALAACLDDELAPLATCALLKFPNGLTLGVTDCDHNLTVEDQLYSASRGAIPTAITTSRTSSPGNLEVTTWLDDELSIGAIRMMSGIGKADVFWLNWQHLDLGIGYICQNWRIGDIKVRGGAVTIELRSLSSMLARNFGKTYGPRCRCTLGDAQCKVVLADHTIAGIVHVVNAGDSHRTFTPIDTTGADYFTNGTLTFTDDRDPNKGFASAVDTYNSVTQEITLARPAPYVLGPSMVWSCTWGCDKSRSQCRIRYSNVVHYRGFDLIPTAGRLPIKYARPRDRTAWGR